MFAAQCVVSLGLLVWYGASRILHYGATAGMIIAFVMYLNLLFRPLRMMADKFNVLQMGIIAGERVFAVLERGDSADPQKLFREFRGRDPELNPLLERQGLIG